MIKMLKKFLKKISLFVLILSFFVLSLFLLLGLSLSVLFLQNLFTGYKFGLFQVLFLVIGIYLVYRPIIHIRFLINNRNKFNVLFNKFIEKNGKAVVIAAGLSIVVLLLYYTGAYLEFNFFLSVVLYFPVFLLNNLVFMASTFLLRYDLLFFVSLMKLILPLSEILFLYYISKIVVRFINK